MTPSKLTRRLSAVLIVIIIVDIIIGTFNDLLFHNIIVRGLSVLVLIVSVFIIMCVVGYLIVKDIWWMCI